MKRRRSDPEDDDAHCPDTCDCESATFVCVECGVQRWPDECGEPCEECGFCDLACPECGEVYSAEEIDMPGPVSDSYDPEFGTAANVDEIRESLQAMYAKLSDIIERGIGPGRNPQPIHILQLVRARELSSRIPATLNEREWRVLRFALERSMESL